MKNALILHGTSGSPESNWFSWLKGELEKQGYNVWLPQLPTADTPNAETYNSFLLSNDDFAFNDGTLIIGHSSGAVATLHLLQELPQEVRIKAAILVSAFKNDLGWDALKGLFSQPLDFTSIKQHCSEFVFIHSDDDPYCPLEHAEYLSDQTAGKLIVIKGQGHFNTELGPHYKEFPEMLKILKDEML